MRCMRVGAFGLVALLLAVGATPATAQRAGAALVPDTATVGQIVRVAVRVALPAGASAALPDSLALPPDLETAGARRLVVDTAGGRTLTATYPVTAWRPGRVSLGTVTVILTGGAVDSFRVALPDLVVASVLPADTAGIEARPAKDVLGADRLWWPIVLLLLLMAALAALAWWLWRRRRARRGQAAPAPPPAVDPREEALAALARAADMPLDHPDQVKFCHARLTAALRHYAAAVEPRLGPDLTTTELATRAAGEPALQPLMTILRRADLVKFARRPASADEARAELARGRAWVEAWPAPAEVGGEEQAA